MSLTADLDSFIEFAHNRINSQLAAALSHWKKGPRADKKIEKAAFMS